jgi:DNA-binding GntR family transcriptional regulator
MRAANARLAEALRVWDTGAALTSDRALHGTFIAASANGELRTTLHALECKVQRIERAFWGAADRTASLTDHAELIGAIEARDAECAQRALARNWERGLAWVSPDHPPESATP